MELLESIQEMGPLIFVKLNSKPANTSIYNIWYTRISLTDVVPSVIGIWKKHMPDIVRDDMIYPIAPLKFGNRLIILSHTL